MSGTKIIKRYQNRKLYDTEASTYVTLDDITHMIRDGEDVRVIDNKNKKDLTSITFAQIIFEEQKKSREILPLSALKRIIQSGGDSIQGFVEKRIAPGIDALQAAQKEVEQKIEKLGAHGKIPAEDGLKLFRELVATSQTRIDELQHNLDERLHLAFDRIRGNATMQKEIDELETKVANLEVQLATEQAKNAKKTRKSSRKTKRVSA